MRGGFHRGAVLPFLSTLSLRRATIGLRCVGVFLGISIHALLAESDWRTCAACTAKQYFYPRSPCGERLAYFQPHALSVLFLSTLSLRRATRFQCGAIQHNKDFYPRSPCGERRGLQPKAPTGPKISIHALLAESDRHYYYICNNRRAFLSTLSLRRATLMKERTINWHQFLSTLSLRRATRSAAPWQAGCRISIHALLAESDRQCTLYGRVRTNFYPRSPCGERRLRGTTAT